MKIGKTRQPLSPTFCLLTALFAVCLIVSNLMEIKVVALGPLTITAGVLVFPLSYIINDCIVEIYGLRLARRVILTGFALNLLTTMLLQLGLALPSDMSPAESAAMQIVFGATPRILTASFSAFLIGSLVNARIMALMKRRSGDNTSKRSFSLRAILSTVAGEGADSVIFFPIAFAGVLPSSAILGLIITQTLLKTLYEVIILPVTLTVVAFLRRYEADPTEPEMNNSSAKQYQS